MYSSDTCLADSSLQEPYVQEDVGYCLPSKPWCFTSFPQENSCTHCSYVQTADAWTQEKFQWKSQHHSVALTFHFNSLPLIRAPQLAGKSAWPVTHGRQVMLTLILPSQATGLRNALQDSGPLSMHCLALCRWTVHTTEVGLVKYSTKYAITFKLFTKCVFCFAPNDICLLTLLCFMYRLVMLPVTMPKTTILCWRNSIVVITSKLRMTLMSNAVTSGTSAPCYLHTIRSDILHLLCSSFQCLAHIINLATQAVISVCSKSH